MGKDKGRARARAGQGAKELGNTANSAPRPDGALARRGWNERCAEKREKQVRERKRK